MCSQSYNSYVHISSWYDQIMCHVDYSEWSQYIATLLKKHKVVPTRILELGAGTCQHARFLDFGSEAYTVYTDLSETMLQNAWSKSTLKTTCCDMRALPFKPGFDFVMMLYDAFNYMVTEYEVEDMFKEVYRVLEPEGHFLFDMTTEYNSETYFMDDAFHEDCGDFEYVRNSWYDPNNNLQHNDFIFFVKTENGLYAKIEEDHIQKVYPYKQVVAQCKAAGFIVKGAYSEQSLKKPTGKSLRIHLLVQKP